MNNSIHILVLITLSVFGMQAFAEEVPIIFTDRIELSTYSDTKSILLDWSIPEDIRVSKITIYRAEDYTSTFTPITEITEPLNCYLDTLTIPGQRYFYYIELEGVNGIVYGSSREHPSFNRVKVGNEDQDVIVNEELSFDSWEGVVNHVLHKVGESTFGRLLPGFESLMQNDSLRMEDLTYYGSIRELFDVDLYGVLESKDSLIAAVEKGFRKAEKSNRNALLMTPAEWDNELAMTKTYLSEQIEIVHDLLQEFQDYVATLPPIRISSVTRANSDSVLVDLEIITFRDKWVSLMYKDQSIEVVIPDTLDANRSLQVQIPGDWPSVEIVYSGQVIDHRLVDGYYSEYKINVFNNLIPEPYLQESKGLDHFINEIRFNPEANQLAVELFVPAEIALNYQVVLNDSLIWALSELPSYEDVYYDSVFTLTRCDSNPSFWIQGFMIPDDNEPVWNESVLLSNVEQTHIARYPNGKYWKKAEWASFGTSNDEEMYKMQELAVPEVFALYQNYPNPFNNGTTISFDLLQEATVTLHVSDATGRVVESFLEQTLLNSGRYSYQWFGSHNSSGVYFFTVYAEVENFLPVSYSRKMIYLK